MAGQRRSAISLASWASLFLIVAQLATLALSQSCSMCQFRAGTSLGALDLRGSQPSSKTSLTLSTATSSAIQSSETPLSFTLESWVRPSYPSLRRPQPIFARYPRTSPLQGNSRAEFVLQVQANGNLNLFFGGGSANKNRLALNLDCGFNAVPALKWTHVALTVATAPGLVNPSAAKVYLNGRLQCQWPGTDAANTTFSGTRQIMHDQPFLIGRYERDDCEGDDAIQTFAGRVDAVRVWAGVRTATEIAATYRLADVSGESSLASSLVNALLLDRVDEDELTLQSATASVGDNADFQVAADVKPDWVASDVPMLQLAKATNFLLAPLTLFVFAVDAADTFGAEIDLSSLSALETIYIDSNGQIPLAVDNILTVGLGYTFPQAYFYTRSPVDYNTTIRYRAVSYDDEATPFYSNWAQIEVTVKVTGCDGEGGEMDRCGVCLGQGRCEPFGCDGQGSRLDECGVCDGSNECRCYNLRNWRGFTTDTLDKSILFYDLAHLNGSMISANDALDKLTTMLLALDDGVELGCSNVTTALAQVKRLQAKTSIYKERFLPHFIDELITA